MCTTHCVAAKSRNHKSKTCLSYCSVQVWAAVILNQSQGCKSTDISDAFSPGNEGNNFDLCLSLLAPRTATPQRFKNHLRLCNSLQHSFRCLNARSLSQSNAMLKHLVRIRQFWPKERLKILIYMHSFQPSACPENLEEFRIRSCWEHTMNTRFYPPKLSHTTNLHTVKE